MLLLPVVLAANTLPAHAQMNAAQSPQILAQTTDETSEQIGTIAEDFVSELSEGGYSSAVQSYDASATTTITPQSLQQNWQDITNEYGPLQRIVGTQTVPLEDSDYSYTVIVTAEFADATRDIFVTFSGNEVVGFSVAEE